MKNKKKIITTVVIVFLISVLTVFAIFYVKRKIKLDRLYNGISEEIEYQVGNYVNGGLFVNGCTYVFTDNSLLGHYDETGEWVSQPNEVIYKVDNQGNCEEFYVFDDLKFAKRKPWIYYYKGWLYFEAIDPKSEKLSQIFRISEDGKDLEVIYETDSTLLFGIRDDYMILSDESNVYCIDLTEGMDFTKKEKLERRSFNRSLYYYFFGYWIYNCKHFHMAGHDEYDINLRQYYDGNIYTIMSDSEYDGDTAYEKRKLVRKIYTKDEYTVEELHSDVLCFNIFNDKLYYVICVGDKNEVWCSDMDGSNAERFYQTEFDKKLYCKNIIVGEQNIICDFGPGTDSAITDRCIIGKQLEYVNYISFSGK